MIKNVIDYNREINACGWFWLPEHPEQKYAGTLDFSATSAIQIILMECGNAPLIDKPSLVNGTSFLFGFVQEIGYITLIGLHSYGLKSTIADVSYLSELINVEKIIIGCCLNLNQKNVSGISFLFSELGNLIDDNPIQFNIKDNVPIIDEPLDDVCSFQIAPYTYGSIPIADETLHKFHRNQFLMQSNYVIKIIGEKNQLDFFEQYQIKMEKLFSILCNRQVKSLYTFLLVGSEEFQVIQPTLLNGLFIPPKSDLPVSIENLQGKMQQIWGKCCEILGYDLIDRYITDRYYTLIPPGALMFSLLVSMIDVWQMKHNHTNDKYQNFFESVLTDNTNFSVAIKKYLLNFTNTQSMADFGKAISAIRSLILHADNITESSEKYKKYNHFLENETLMGKFCEILSLGVTAKFLDELDIQQTPQQKNNLLKYLTQVNI